MFFFAYVYTAAVHLPRNAVLTAKAIRHSVRVGPIVKTLMFLLYPVVVLGYIPLTGKHTVLLLLLLLVVVASVKGNGAIALLSNVPCLLVDCCSCCVPYHWVLFWFGLPRVQHHMGECHCAAPSLHGF